jgi:hypothetical protein
MLERVEVARLPAALALAVWPGAAFAGSGSGERLLGERFLFERWHGV